MEKKSIEIQLFEIYKIYEEFNGSENPNTQQIKGILNEKIKLIAKYNFDEINDTEIKPEKTRLDKLRDELILKYGKFDNGGYKIEQFDEEGKPNEKYLAFYNEFTELLNSTKTIEFYPIKLADIANVEDEYNYKMIYKFLER